MTTKFFVFLAALALIILPFSAGAQLSSTTYQIDPGENTISIRHNVTSTSYEIDGAIEPLTGTQTSTTFEVESGEAFRYYCGDGFVDPDESCDTGSYGTNLNGKTCVSEGFASGTISCTSACAFNTSSCVAASSGGGGGGGGSSSSSTSAPASPTINETFTEEDYFTYESSLLLYGTIDSQTTSITVNGESATINGTTWQLEVDLEEGDNEFEMIAKNSSGKSSVGSTVTIHRRAMADINDDASVNDYDLSLLIQLWLTNDKEGDFNVDEVVDDYDFSILVSNWS